MSSKPKGFNFYQGRVKAIFRNKYWKSKSWDDLVKWMKSRWESLDAIVSEKDLKDLIEKKLPVDDFISKFSHTVSLIHDIDMPQVRVLTDLFTRGLGRENTLMILSEGNPKKCVTMTQIQKSV